VMSIGLFATMQPDQADRPLRLEHSNSRAHSMEKG